MPRTTPKIATVSAVTSAALVLALAMSPAWADVCTFFPDPGAQAFHEGHPGEAPHMGPMGGGFGGMFGAPRITGPASARMRGYIQQITRILGVAEVPIYKGSVPNAAATPQGILYNPGFMTQLLRRAGERGVISVLAHEVGHKVNRDDTFYTGLTHPWDKELRADYLSGFVLAKLGASARESTAALRSLYSGHDSPSHPSTEKRIPAVEAGWRSARTGEQVAPRQERIHASRQDGGDVNPPAAERPPARPPSITWPPEERPGTRRAAARPRKSRARYVHVPCAHAAHRYDVLVEMMPTPYGWQRVQVRVPCEHARHRADRQRVVAYERMEAAQQQMGPPGMVGVYVLE